MDTVLIKDFPPNATLGEFVRKYQVFRLLFQKDKPLPVKYHTPHPEHCITFYLRDVQKYSNLDSQTIITYPRCVINGMYEIPINRYGGYDFLAIKIVLQPGILYRLTGISPQELANSFIDAEALWGKEVRLVLQELTDAQELKQMLTILDKFFWIFFQTSPL